MKRLSIPALICVILLGFAGCRSVPPELKHARRIDLDQFMGTWYVHGYTPILVDKDAYNATESYERQESGRIQATYQFNKGAADGPQKTYTPVAWVHDKELQTEWRIRFVWPFKSKYLIMHVDDDYQETLVVHPGKKYAWIMTRSPARDEQQYLRLLGKLTHAGFDASRIKDVPHSEP